MFWNYLNKLNPEFTFAIKNLDWVLNVDRSYLIRRAAFEKGLLLYKENPITGIGLMNFEDANIYQPLDFEGNQWIRGKKLTYNSGSFNSYIQILAEGGLLMFIPFSIIMLFPFYKLVVNPLMPNEKTPFLISFICISQYICMP